MKVKLKNTKTKLPSCWKLCECSYEDWKKLQLGEEIEMKNIHDVVKNLIEEVKVKKDKGGK
tara:strand:+ start:1051 stop:1233 length:183 start_codon:yes stop_codon:yes gene_type:complete